MWLWLTLAAVAAAVVLVLLLVWRPWSARARRGREERAQREFRIQRERLEAVFLDIASQSGKPRGLRWVDCEFSDEVTYARDRRRGALLAFVGVTISFEAVEGGGMEDVEAVGNLRAATAIFTSTNNGWRTDGRAVFNLEPAEAIARYEHEFEPFARPDEKITG